MADMLPDDVWMTSPLGYDEDVMVDSLI